MNNIFKSNDTISKKWSDFSIAMDRIYLKYAGRFRPFRPSFINEMMFAFLIYIAKINVKKIDMFEVDLFTICNLIGDDYLKEHMSKFVFECIRKDRGRQWKGSDTKLMLEELSDLKILKSDVMSLLGYDLETIKSYILLMPDSERQSYMSPNMYTPGAISTLAVNLLEINADDKVIDNCCGLCSFFSNLYSFGFLPKRQLYGVDIAKDFAPIWKIKKYVSEGTIKCEIGNALTKEWPFKFNKGFTHFPLEITKKESCWIDNETCFKYEKAFGKSTTVGWWYTLKLLDLLEDDGLGVSIMLSGDLSNAANVEIRKELINRKKIKAIILLPNDLMTHTAVPISLLLLGNNNGKVKFIDATKIYTAGRRLNTLSAENIDQIMNAYKNDCGISTTVQENDIEKQNYDLDPKKYIENESNNSTNSMKHNNVNLVEFSALIEKIRRGAQLSAQELDRRISTEETEYKHLSISDIQDGIIVDKLEYIDKINKNEEKYCIEKSGALIVSKNGFPPKIAVAEVKDNEKIMVNGNLFIINLDTKKCNPYYIKAYLESDEGVKALNSIVINKTIPYIGVDKLQTIKIPKISIGEQEEFAKKYKNQMDIIKDTKEELNKESIRLKNLIYEIP